jgi:four helix bundle protein
MTTQPPLDSKLPHHTLVGYQLCLELVRLVAGIRIADAQLRQQARKSATSAALNAAEGAARESAGDKRRCYGIASGEACEACAAVEIAGALGACASADVQAVLALVRRIRRVFFPLVR